MQLTHIAIWTNELERSRDFYIKYFNGKSNEKYVNPKKGFASYFVTFEGGASLEIMQRTDITKETFGAATLRFSCGMTCPFCLFYRIEREGGCHDRTVPFGRLQDRRRAAYYW